MLLLSCLAGVFSLSVAKEYHGAIAAVKDEIWGKTHHTSEKVAFPVAQVVFNCRMGALFPAHPPASSINISQLIPNKKRFLIKFRIKPGLKLI
jgi:hypothetical protein